MSSEAMARSTGLPPLWKSLLAVIAHPDYEPFGLGAVLDAFIFAGSHQEEGIDLRVTFERARQRVASREDAAPAVPGSARWRRLELLGDTESLRWLRQPTHMVGQSGTVDSLTAVRRDGSNGGPRSSRSASPR